MAKIKPKRIPGRWREGFTLDYHTISSVYLGYDEYGNPMYDTQRTEIGELLYRLKYRSDKTVLKELVDAVESFLISWKPPIELIIPVPPSRPGRVQQPVISMAEEIGRRIKIPVKPECVIRVKELPELKSVYDFDERVSLLDGAFKVDSSLVGERRVLLFDDLFRSGATMNAIANALYYEGYVKDVYALTITRTKSKT